MIHSSKAPNMRRAQASLDEWIDESARLICDEGYADYRSARGKAAQRLGISARTTAPDLRRIEAAVLQRQALFGGSQYTQRLLQMRRTALQAMRLLAEYEPRLAGSTVSGAIGEGHRVQLHLEADPPEAVELHLHHRRIDFDQDERRYRMADGRDHLAPLLSFEADDVGVDVVIFPTGAHRQPPLSRIDGRPARRLDIEQVRALVEPADRGETGLPPR